MSQAQHLDRNSVYLRYGRDEECEGAEYFPEI
jgi:hypothetical protein